MISVTVLWVLSVWTFARDYSGTKETNANERNMVLPGGFLIATIPNLIAHLGHIVVRNERTAITLKIARPLLQGEACRPACSHSGLIEIWADNPRVANPCMPPAPRSN